MLATKEYEDIEKKVLQGERLSREDDNRKDRSAGTPAAGRNPQGTRSTFRQEMRAARLRQEERRQEEEKRRAEREKVRQEAQAYIYGRTEEAERKALEDRAAGRETFRARQEQKAEALEKKDRRSLFRKRKKAPAGTEAGNVHLAAHLVVRLVDGLLELLSAHVNGQDDLAVLDFLTGFYTHYFLPPFSTDLHQCGFHFQSVQFYMIPENNYNFHTFLP